MAKTMILNLIYHSIKSKIVHSNTILVHVKYKNNTICTVEYSYIKGLFDFIQRILQLNDYLFIIASYLKDRPNVYSNKKQ
jgi:hypothetical protein